MLNYKNYFNILEPLYKMIAFDDGSDESMFINRQIYNNSFAAIVKGGYPYDIVGQEDQYAVIVYNKCVYTIPVEDLSKTLGVSLTAESQKKNKLIFATKEPPKPIEQTEKKEQERIQETVKTPQQEIHKEPERKPEGISAPFANNNADDDVKNNFANALKKHASHTLSFNQQPEHNHEKTTEDVDTKPADNIASNPTPTKETHTPIEHQTETPDNASMQNKQAEPIRTEPDDIVFYENDEDTHDADIEYVEESTSEPENATNAEPEYGTSTEPNENNDTSNSTAADDDLDFEIDLGGSDEDSSEEPQEVPKANPAHETHEDNRQHNASETEKQNSESAKHRFNAKDKTPEQQPADHPHKWTTPNSFSVNQKFNAASAGAAENILAFNGMINASQDSISELDSSKNESIEKEESETPHGIRANGKFLRRNNDTSNANEKQEQQPQPKKEKKFNAKTDEKGKLFRHIYDVTLTSKYNEDISYSGFKFYIYPTYVLEDFADQASADVMIRATAQNGDEAIVYKTRNESEALITLDGKSFGVVAKWDTGVFETTITTKGTTFSKYDLDASLTKEEPSGCESDNFLAPFRKVNKGKPTFFVVPYETSNKYLVDIPIMGYIAVKTSNGLQNYVLRMRHDENSLKFNYQGSGQKITGRWINGQFSFDIEDDI